MDNNYDNTPKENDGLNQPVDGTNTSGQANSDAAGQYTDPNAGEQPSSSQQYPYTSQNAYGSGQTNGGYQYVQRQL